MTGLMARSVEVAQLPIKVTLIVLYDSRQGLGNDGTDGHFKRAKLYRIQLQRGIMCPECIPWTL
jgi:hypothetical protein